MATRPKRTNRTTRRKAPSNTTISTNPEDLLRAAMQRDDGSLETGRYLVAFKEGMMDKAMKEMKQYAFRIADAREFRGQAVNIEDTGDAEVLMLPEVGVALVDGDAMRARGMSPDDEIPVDSCIEMVEPEYFVFASNSDYMRGFLSAANTIARDIGTPREIEGDEQLGAQALGVTWGLTQCKVHTSTRSGHGIKVAVLDTGFDEGHPDFAGRQITTASFVGQPVLDMHGHGTHCIGTACGPKSPSGTTPRYGIAFGARIFVGKVLTNAGGSTGGSVLAGMNWAIAQRCEVISMSLGGQSPVQRSYTNAGAAALRNRCLIIAAAGNEATNTGAPANSPTIMSVASLDPSLTTSSFSNFGKVEIAAPGRDVFSSWPRPLRYKTISGTSMATPHVAGCAALWAQTSSSLRGMDLWRKLESTVKTLSQPVAKVGAGMVQAPQ